MHEAEKLRANDASAGAGVGNAAEEMDHGPTTAASVNQELPSSNFESVAFLVAGRQAAIAMSILFSAYQTMTIEARAGKGASERALGIVILCGTIASTTDAIVTWKHDRRRASWGHVARSVIWAGVGWGKVGGRVSWTVAMPEWAVVLSEGSRLSSVPDWVSLLRTTVETAPQLPCPAIFLGTMHDHGEEYYEWYGTGQRAKKAS